MSLKPNTKREERVHVYVNLDTKTSLYNALYNLTHCYSMLCWEGRISRSANSAKYLYDFFFLFHHFGAVYKNGRFPIDLNGQKKHIPTRSPAQIPASSPPVPALTAARKNSAF